MLNGAEPMPHHLDVTGLICPLPVLKARKAISGIDVGETMTVVATDPASVIDFPHFCQEAGHELVSQREDGERFVFEIRRGPPR